MFIAAIPSGEWNTAATAASRYAGRRCHEIHQVNDTHTTAMFAFLPAFYKTGGIRLELTA
jgi:hypothetical protein